MTEYQFPKASLKHRLGQAFLEYGLFIVTLGVGYIIWFWISLGNGQTPGKQILKLRVYDSVTGKPAKWGHMFVREFLVKGLLIPLLSVVTFGIMFLVDSLMVVRDDRKTLHDRICGSIVVQR